MWTDRFGGNPFILDRTIRLKGEAYQMIGVLPAGLKFGGLRGADLFAVRLRPVTITRVSDACGTAIRQLRQTGN